MNVAVLCAPFGLHRRTPPHASSLYSTPAYSAYSAYSASTLSEMYSRCLARATWRTHS
jgi:hypothetical protein